MKHITTYRKGKRIIPVWDAPIPLMDPLRKILRMLNAKYVKKLCILALLFLAACGKSGSLTGTGEPPEPAPRVILAPLPEVPASRIYGYYAYGAEGAGCGFTNWILVAVNSQSVEKAKEMAEAARACHQVVSYAISGPWKHWPDTFRPIAQVFADYGVLHSVYVADEPMATGMKYADLAQRIADVRAAGFKAMITEQGGGIQKPHPAIDYYGLDWYDVQLRWLRLTLQRNPEINILVPPSYMPYAGNAPLNNDHTPNQEAYVQLAKEMHVGIAYWMWPSIGPWTGAEDIPTVQAQQRRLWAKW